MTTNRKVIVGVVAAPLIAGLAVLVIGAWWASSLYQSEQADQTRAGAAFAEIRARFPGIEPAFQIRDRRLVIARQPGTATSPTSPAAVHLLVWQPRERMLSRATLPLWISKIATEPPLSRRLPALENRGSARYSKRSVAAAS